MRKMIVSVNCQSKRAAQLAAGEHPEVDDKGTRALRRQKPWAETAVDSADDDGGKKEE